MGVIETRVFKAGDDAAVRLPKELGFEPGTLVTIIRTPLGLTIEPVVASDPDPEAALRNNQALAAELRAIWAAHPGGPPVPETRDPDIFPDRPGLY